MANKLYEENSIRDIASAIREKNGTANTYNVAEMGQAIRGIPTNGAGGSSNLPSNIKTGTFTIAEDTIEPQVILHNAGSVPIGVLVMIDELSNPYGIKTKTIGGLSLGRNEAVVFNNTGKMAYGATTCITEITESTFTLNPRGETYPFSSQSTYRWWVWI